jgi:hypothetical protein
VNKAQSLKTLKVTRTWIDPERTPDTLRQAAEDWIANHAYLDNAGNYRLRGPNQIAPWNGAVKRDAIDAFLKEDT